VEVVAYQEAHVVEAAAVALEAVNCSTTSAGDVDEAPPF